MDNNSDTDMSSIISTPCATPTHEVDFSLQNLVRYTLSKQLFDYYWLIKCLLVSATISITSIKLLIYL